MYKFAFSLFRSYLIADVEWNDRATFNQMELMRHLVAIFRRRPTFKFEIYE